MTDVGQIVHDVLQRIWDSFISFIKSLLSNITDPLNAASKWITENIVNPVLSGIGEAWKSFWAGVFAPFTAFIDGFRNYFTMIQQALTNMYNAWAQHIIPAFGPLSPIVVTLVLALVIAIIILVIKLLPGNPF